MSRGRPNDLTLLRKIRRAEEIRLPPHKRAAERKCLGCGVMFDSKWIGNRLCAHCCTRDGGGAWAR